MNDVAGRERRMERQPIDAKEADESQRDDGGIRQVALAAPHALSRTSSAESHSKSHADPVPAAVDPLKEEDVVPLSPVDKKALWSLIAQHLSSSWVARSFEFAIYLFLIEIFPGSLRPASIYGFITTGAAVLFSGSVGSMVGSHRRLPFIRLNIILQKSLSAIVYALFLILFTRLSVDHDGTVVWFLFSLVTILGSVLKLSTIGMTVSIERDWVMTIAENDSARLTQLNTYLRRVDLISALVSPLFVSLLTSVKDYAFTAAFLLGMSLSSMVFEWIWIDTVYRRLPILEAEQSIRLSQAEKAKQQSTVPSHSQQPTFNHLLFHIRSASTTAYLDWKDFVTSPVFPSSLSISLLYLTVLSFDGQLLSFLLTHGWSNAILSGMRGICVVAGLTGTLVMPILEGSIGLVRTGTWSIVSQLLCLLPVTLTFFINAPPDGEKGSLWNAAVLFAFLALSRIGLWSFDLVQLKQLQLVMADHPRKNTLTALQFSLQNVMDLLRFVLTIVLSRPSQYKYAAAVSFFSVVAACLSYLVYVKQQRGHVLMHLSWQSLIKKRT